MSELVSVDPSDGEILWRGQQASTADVDTAVAAAREAGRSWARRSVADRLGFLESYREVVRRRRDELVHALARETGKPLWECHSEVDSVIAKVAISADALEQRAGHLEHAGTDALSVTRHKPHGVMAVLGPFNFPAHLPNGHIVPALLAGNTIVFKPSEHTPLVGEKLVSLLEEAGLPEGVVGLVQGDGSVGVALVTHDSIDGVCFTGSAAVGASIHRALAGRPERIVALEMGGNNPLVVGTVQDTEAVIHHTIQSAFVTTGQRCTCARRWVIPGGEHGDGLLAALAAQIKRLIVGRFDEDPEPFCGPLISERAAEDLLRVQDELVEAGATAVVAMQKGRAGSGFVTPGLIEAGGAEVPDTERFGPLLVVQRYGSFDEAIELANATRFGLAAGLLSHDRRQYEQFWSEVHAGVLSWNRPLTGASSAAPFGGVKASGNHRPGAFYAADYCAYPVASLEAEALVVPPGALRGLRR